MSCRGDGHWMTLARWTSLFSSTKLGEALPGMKKKHGDL